MHLMNRPRRYGVVTKFFHWSIFLLFVAQFALGYAIMGGAVGEHLDPARLPSIGLHLSLGLLLLVLAVLRLLWRRLTPLPNWARTLTKRERRIAHWTEQALYAAMIGKPLSGLTLALADGQPIPFFGLFSLPSVGTSQLLVDVSVHLHAWTGFLFFAAWAAHLGLIFKHQFVNRDRLLYRMLPFTHQ
jgi:cytochrome b561